MNWGEYPQADQIIRDNYDLMSPKSVADLINSKLALSVTKNMVIGRANRIGVSCVRNERRDVIEHAERCEKIVIEALRAGYKMGAAAAKAGLTRMQIVRLRRRNPDFAKAVWDLKKHRKAATVAKVAFIPPPPHRPKRSTAEWYRDYNHRLAHAMREAR